MGITVVGDDCHNDKFSDASREALVMMDDATNFMGNTLNDVLSMDKIEEGAMHLKMSPFYMEDIFNVSISTMKGSAESKQISIALSSGVDGKQVNSRTNQFIGDRFRLEHVIVNFLSNAVKFSPMGSQIVIKMIEKVPDARIMTCIRQRNSFSVENGKKRETGPTVLNPLPSKEYREVTVTVIDNGVGLSKADLSNIFTAYSQVRPEQLQQGRGTGLGLVLAKEIISMHGGRVVVESVEGQGSSFGFCIPFEVYTEVEEAEIVRKGPTALVQTDLKLRNLDEKEVEPIRNLVNIERDLVQSLKIPEAGDNVGMSPRYRIESCGTSPECSDKGLEGLEEVDGLGGEGLEVVTSVGSSPRSGVRGASGDNSPLMGDILVRQRERFGAWTERESRDDLLANCIDAMDVCTTPRPFVIKKCLIVDDTQSNSKMLALVLKKRDILSDIAENGLEAVKAVNEKGHEYDVIFMDHTMPIMTGTEASRQIRSNGYNRLIFGVTGNALDDDVEAFLTAGADCVIAKPLRAPALDAVLRHIAENGMNSDPKMKLNIEKTIHDGCLITMFDMQLKI
eukprot:CAMPEP_0119042986 /NCGR_PEP_ID=MMETSP1177-20130426/16320_1 /TAXON_ID=2985 /ORGANISM="Ochromonas sp, Strain CCMP1899" /LENGTH=564 /DNA_ID=CAMNT_0007010129 /DNA_START=1274 /DNA_END=2968 /DNA_ORIENTATION=+